MFRIVSFALCAAVCWGTAELSAAPPLGEQLKPAVKQSADVSKKQNLTTILILVREDDGSDADRELAEMLAAIRDEIKTVLTAEQLQGGVSVEIEQSLDDANAGALLPADIAPLKQKSKFDAVFVAVYRKQGKGRSLRLSLLDEKKRHWTRTVALPTDTTIVGRQPATGRNTSGTTNTTGGFINRGATGVAGGTSSSAAGGATSIGLAQATANATSNAQAGGTASGTAKKSEEKPDPKDAAKSGDVSALNGKILAFASSQIGQQVGNGECWTLGAEALKSAGAEPPKGYDFGDEIALDQIAPGDILQFKSVQFVDGTTIKYFGTPDHTAIVYALRDNRIYILHQHVGDTKTVTTGDINLATKTTGEITAYRATPAKSSKQKSM